MSKNENFKKCPSWPNYEINIDGTCVKRIDTGRVMSISERGISKYLATRTCHNNIPQNTFIHKMVADAWLFNDDPEHKTQVNHKDGNKQNNHASNLEHCTPSQNQQHAVKTRLKGSGEDLYNSSTDGKTIHEICRLLTQGYRVSDISSIFDISKDVVRKIRDGSTWFEIRSQYNIVHNYKNEFSESTVRWVCEQILEGYSDKTISDNSLNKDLTVIDIKRIRNKIRYVEISDEYF